MINILLFTVISVLAGIQMASLFSVAIPINVLDPEYITCFVFVLTVIICQAFGLWCLRHRLDDSRVKGTLIKFVIVDAILTFLLISAQVKMIFYDYNQILAQRSWWVLFILCCAHKFLWRFWYQVTIDAWQMLVTRCNRKFLKMAIVPVALLIIASIVYVPDCIRVVARMFIGEQFHHYDIFVMAAGWAAYCGHIMDVDQISQYGVGMPIVFAQICRWLGGFSHEHVFEIVMWGNIVYFCVMYGMLCQVWRRSPVLNAIAMLVLLRVQLFHPGVYPFGLTYPSATAIRYIFDVFVFILLWMHLKKNDLKPLVLAGVLCAMANVYMDSTGVFLTAAYYFYLLLNVAHPQWRKTFLSPVNRLSVAMIAILPMALTIGLYYAAVGKHMFSGHFWMNLLETVDYFLSGIGTYPMNESFKYHNFFAGVMGFVIPLVHVATIIIVTALVFLGRLSKKNLWIVIVCVYGLGINHYYIARSVLTSYYVTAWPFIVACVFWVRVALANIPARFRLNVIGVLGVLAVYALVTNHNFIAYPNMWNFSANPMVDPLVTQPLPADRTTYFNHLYRNSEEALKLPVNSLQNTDEQLYTETSFLSDDQMVAYYKQEFNFDKDSAMIRSLTKDDERVVVISDFEIKILMQSNRRPFFYYFPLINSRPKYMRILPICFLHTNRVKFNQTAIDQIKEQKPEYIFVERIFAQSPYPKGYMDNADNIVPILEYVGQAYQPYMIGEYLIAMKRKG